MSKITRKFDLQIFISYLGLSPYFFLIIDINLFNFFSESFLKNFTIFYSLLIFSFIGSMRWSFESIVNKYKIIYGFVPSLISTIIITLTLLDQNRNFILCLVVLCLFIQLIFDFIISKNTFEILIFYIVRLPITFLLVFILFYFIFV